MLLGDQPFLSSENAELSVSLYVRFFKQRLNIEWWPGTFPICPPQSDLGIIMLTSRHAEDLNMFGRRQCAPYLSLLNHQRPILLGNRRAKEIQESHSNASSMGKERKDL